MEKYITHTEVMAALSPAQQARIKKRAAELIAEEMTLQDLRKARNLTQTSLARKLKVKQAGISKLETRSDMMLSTLRGYVHKLGGELELVATFPDRAPVRLSSLADIGDTGGGKSPPRKAAASTRARA
jgi:DNA-binding XRE family transcriptional regulator